MKTGAVVLLVALALVACSHHGPKISLAVPADSKAAVRACTGPRPKGLDSTRQGVRQAAGPHATLRAAFVSTTVAVDRMRHAVLPGQVDQLAYVCYFDGGPYQARGNPDRPDPPPFNRMMVIVTGDGAGMTGIEGYHDKPGYTDLPLEHPPA